MQAIPFTGPAKTTALSSPWDLIQLPGDEALYIAMAGPHQIWKLDLDSLTVGVFAGSGYENILDGAPDAARFAQPSGLATDGENLFVADSEVSGVRAITGIAAKEPFVRTIAGTGLFDFGDRDGRGATRPAPALPGRGLSETVSYTSRTATTTRSRSATPKTQSVEDTRRLAQAGRRPTSPPISTSPAGSASRGRSSMSPTRTTTRSVSST